MDDKTFMAAYVADETVRLKDRLKEMVARGEEPSEEEKEALMNEMQASLSRLQQTLLQIQAIVDEENEEEETPGI